MSPSPQSSSVKRPLRNLADEATSGVVNGTIQPRPHPSGFPLSRERRGFSPSPSSSPVKREDEGVTLTPLDTGLRRYDGCAEVPPT